MRVEVTHLSMGRAKLAGIARSGKRPAPVRIGDAILDPKDQETILGYVSEVKTTALPQFYWLYDITCELLEGVSVALGQELEVSETVNVSEATASGQDAAQARAAV